MIRDGTSRMKKFLQNLHTEWAEQSCCNVAIFPSGGSIFPFRYFLDFVGRRKMGVESKKIRGNIYRKGRSRRVVDVNLLHPDEAKSKGGVRSVREDRVEVRPLWGGAWQCVAYYTFLLFIVLHKYRPRSRGCSSEEWGVKG